MFFFPSRAPHCRRSRSPVDPVAAVGVAAEDARDLRDGSGNPEHRQRTFVGPEPRRASGGTAHPIIISKDRPMVFDIDFETAVIELARVRVRREFQQDREGNHALDEASSEVKLIASSLIIRRTVSYVPSPNRVSTCSRTS